MPLVFYKCFKTVYMIDTNWFNLIQTYKKGWCHVQIYEIKRGHGCYGVIVCARCDIPAIPSVHSLVHPIKFVLNITCLSTLRTFSDKSYHGDQYLDQRRGHTSWRPSFPVFRIHSYFQLPYFGRTFRSRKLTKTNTHEWTDGILAGIVRSCPTVNF